MQYYYNLYVDKNFQPDCVLVEIITLGLISSGDNLLNFQHLNQRWNL